MTCGEIERGRREKERGKRKGTRGKVSLSVSVEEKKIEKKTKTFPSPLSPSLSHLQGDVDRHPVDYLEQHLHHVLALVGVVVVQENLVRSGALRGLSGSVGEARGERGPLCDAAARGGGGRACRGGGGGSRAGSEESRRSSCRACFFFFELKEVEKKMRGESRRRRRERGFCSVEFRFASPICALKTSSPPLRRVRTEESR
jgi:hypothetical protein